MNMENDQHLVVAGLEEQMFHIGEENVYVSREYDAQDF